MSFPRLIPILSISAFTAGILSSTASAALLLQFSEAQVNNSTAIIPPMDWADNVNFTSFTPSDASLTRRGTGFANYRGWGTAINPQIYVGFTLSAAPGYTLNFTDFAFTTACEFSPDATFKWGIRIDEGSGYGAWNFSPTYTSADPGYDSSTTLKDWDFSDFSTTGTVQFGLFATAPDAITAITAFRTPSTVNGTVTAVPEPSSMAIAAAGSLVVAGFRRRRSQAGRQDA